MPIAADVSKKRTPFNTKRQRHFYIFLIFGCSNSHRFFIAGRLSACCSKICGEDSMLDIIVLTIGLGFFVVSVGYVYACDRL